MGAQRGLEGIGHQVLKILDFKAEPSQVVLDPKFVGSLSLVKIHVPCTCTTLERPTQLESPPPPHNTTKKVVLQRSSVRVMNGGVVWEVGKEEKRRQRE
uniref:Uncharacterized protein n=1 Tax=Nelumbo nucifera TaxID=4432 RepID=A0A822Z1P8_NELNU|nr:TPA_asm: hypothetical protein HUJ06_007567 [Nelumbo nucifera]